MSKYETELKILRFIYTEFIYKVWMDDCVNEQLCSHIENMKALIELIENEEASFQIMNVIATFASELSAAEYIYTGVYVEPESMYSWLINSILNENQED